MASIVASGSRFRAFAASTIAVNGESTNTPPKSKITARLVTNGPSRSVVVLSRPIGQLARLEHGLEGCLVEHRNAQLLGLGHLGRSRFGAGHESERLLRDAAR